MFWLCMPHHTVHAASPPLWRWGDGIVTPKVCVGKFARTLEKSVGNSPKIEKQTLPHDTDVYLVKLPPSPPIDVLGKNKRLRQNPRRQMGNLRDKITFLKNGATQIVSFVAVHTTYGKGSTITHKAQTCCGMGKGRRRAT